MSAHYEIGRRITIVCLLLAVRIHSADFHSSCISEKSEAESKQIHPDLSSTTRTYSLSISVVGDIMVHDAQLENARDGATNTYDFDPVFKDIKPLISSADLAIGNLETTLPGQDRLYAGYPQFGAPDVLAESIKDAGFDLLTTANNHSCDKGRLGITHTLDVLDSLGLLHLGTYRDEQEYSRGRLLILERNGIRLAFLNYTYGTNGIPTPRGTVVNRIDKKIMEQDAGLARLCRPDFIIALIHAGTEYKHLPDSYQLDKVGFLIDQGVDIVLGGHPHVLQPYKLELMSDRHGEVKPRLIIYSLGNFVSNQRKRYRDGGIIFRFMLKKTKLADQTILEIEKVGFDPVWVYVEALPDKKIHRILPIENVLRHHQSFLMNQKAKDEMMRFYMDTCGHFHKHNRIFPSMMRIINPN